MTKNINELGPDAPTLKEAGFTFRDLNKNGKLDPYEDTRLPVEERVEDLLSQMTIEEKVGLMFHPPVGMNEDGSLLDGTTEIFHAEGTPNMVLERLINHFNIYAVAKPQQMAQWYNSLQKLAERTRLGIPVTISSDPRHGFSHNVAASLWAGDFSLWPEPTGLAATRDPELVKEFGDIARQEYLAVGIRTALHPMADLATEPRWPRINGTFGEDAELSSQMTFAYIKGFQGEKLGPKSVSCMTKHFPGGGPQKDGEDPHFPYGKEQVYPGNNFDYHLPPFEAAFRAGTGQIMPYYGMPIGLPGIEEVGFGYNKDVITGILRGKYKFDGVVCSDWGLITPSMEKGKVIISAKCWGVEELTIPERAEKIIQAGVDQIGGEACTDVIIDLVKSGKLSEERIDESARRILRDKFILGLFDNPYVDPDKAVETVGKAAFREAGIRAQKKSLVLLKNADTPQGPLLPLKGKLKLYVENIKPEVAREYGEVVKEFKDADVAILRTYAPYEYREGWLEQIFHAGSLEFEAEEKARLLNILESVPSVIDIYLDRPAIIPELAEKCAGLFANFGASDKVLLDAIFGKFAPTGKLPFEMPSSQEAVEKQKEDVPYDSENPLFPFGHGLTYNKD